MNALELVGANDDVRDASTVLEDEDGILAAVLAALAGHTAVILAVAKVDGAADSGRLGEGDDAANTGRDVERLGGGKPAGDEGGDDGGLHRE